MTKTYIGIDPGKRPCIAVIEGDKASVATMRDMSEAKTFISEIANGKRHDERLFAAIENPPPKVFIPGRKDAKGKQVDPQQFSQEKLKKSQGILLGMVMMADIPVKEVVPRVWQKGIYGLDKSGPSRKRQLAEEARRRFPELKVTQENADALLIADWARREGM